MGFMGELFKPQGCRNNFRNLVVFYARNGKNLFLRRKSTTDDYHHNGTLSDFLFMAVCKEERKKGCVRSVYRNVLHDFDAFDGNGNHGHIRIFVSCN